MMGVQPLGTILSLAHAASPFLKVHSMQFYRYRELEHPYFK